MKPIIFIGSSVEGLPVAKALQTNLEHYAFVEIWTQTEFQLSSTTLSSLIDTSKKANFAIFVFSPDDVLEIRNNKVKAIRDNVIFELGLFIGTISINNVYFIKPRGEELHLPTDIIGLTSGDYDAQNPNIEAAVGSFCTRVEKQIKKLYSYEFPNEGRGGLNLLSENIQVIEKDVNYCLSVKIPKGAEFILNVIQPNYLNSGDTQSLIGYTLGTALGFQILKKDAKGIYLSLDLKAEVGEYDVKVYPESNIIFKGFLNGTKILEKEFGHKN